MLLLPPAPAARVLLGRAFASLSFWSAAARRRIAVLGPPGGVGDEGRAGAEEGEFTGEEERGEDLWVLALLQSCEGLRGGAKWQFGMRVRRRGRVGKGGEAYHLDCGLKDGLEQEVKIVQAIDRFRTVELVCASSCKGRCDCVASEIVN